MRRDRDRHGLRSLAASLGWLAALASCALGCPSAPGEPAARPEAKRASPPLVLLISLDTLRADHLGAYGYDRPTSPRLDALAAEGTLFTQAHSTSTWTLPAHASLLTGRYVDQHRVRDESHRLTEATPTVATLLAAAGWETGAVVNSLYLSLRFGLQQGFEHRVYVPEAPGRIGPSTWISDQALQWIDARDATRPLFLFLHYYDIHSDYAALPEFRARFERPYGGDIDGTTGPLVEVQRGERTLDATDAARLVDLYDAGIRQTDAELGRLFDGLRDRKLLEPAWILITSDHGEEFLEHGGVLHGRTQYQEQLRVPLIVRGPGVPDGKRIETPVSLVDVAPTLLELAGIALPDGLDGIALQRRWDSESSTRQRVLFSESRHGLDEPVETFSARIGRFKTIREHDGRVLVFDLDSDPGELRPLRRDAPEAADALPHLLDAFVARVRSAATADPTSPALTPDEIRHLRELGYLRD